MSHSAPITMGHARFYGHPAQTADGAGFSLAHLRVDPHATVQRHTHETAHFVLLLRGAYITTARDAPLLCTRPTLIYNPPGTTHRDRFADTNGDVRGRFFTLSIAAERYEGIAEVMPLVDAPLCMKSGHAMALATRLARECYRWDEVSPLASEGMCLELLAEVARTRLRTPRTPPSWLSTAREMLRGDWVATVSVGDVARAVGVHPVHLARAFRQCFSCSPGDYLRHCRLERAAALLRESRHALSMVALTSGFADQSHLTKAFREAFGVTPGVYRQRTTSEDVHS